MILVVGFQSQVNHHLLAPQRMPVWLFLRAVYCCRRRGVPVCKRLLHNSKSDRIGEL